MEIEGEGRRKQGCGEMRPSEGYTLRRKERRAGPRAAEEPRKVSSDPTNYWLGSVDVPGNPTGAVAVWPCG